MTLREQVRAFAAEAVEEPVIDCWQRGFSREFSETLGVRGWLGIMLPREWGGAGGTAAERFMVAEELLAAGAPVAAHWITERQVAPAILRLGSDEQKRRFLPGIARGEIVVAIGMSEPGSGSDLASVKTRARRCEGGWRLNGQKTWSSFAHEADHLLVLCRTSEGETRHDGLSQLLVDCSLDGVEIRQIETMGGDDHFCEVFFDDVLVPGDPLLGEEGQGWRQVNAELAFERGGPERYLSTWPLFAAFAAQARDELSVHAVGELGAEVIAVRQLAAGIAAAMDEGRDFRVAAAVEKDAGTTLEQRLVETVGRFGDDSDPDFARLLADASAAAPAFTLRGGTTEILRTIVSREL
jgi:alkylation response protein AidB-like acyl-CoA dehydrogenase